MITVGSFVLVGEPICNSPSPVRHHAPASPYLSTTDPTAIMEADPASYEEVTVSTATDSPAVPAKRTRKARPQLGFACWNKIPFLVFDGKAHTVSTKDGIRFVVKEKNGTDKRIRLVTIYDDDYKIWKRSDKQAKGGKKAKTAVPTAKQTGGSDDSDVELVGVYPNSLTGIYVPKKTARLYENTHGKVEIKRKETGKTVSPCEGMPRFQVFNRDNVSHYVEAHATGYIDYIDRVVMNREKQSELWGNISHHNVPRSDPTLNGILEDLGKGGDDELIESCHIIKRAFQCFISRASHIYFFLFPHMERADNFIRSEILLQIWLGLPNSDRELIYYGRSSFNADSFNVIAKFPPGNLEKRILEQVFPGGVKAEPVPTFPFLFSDLLALKMKQEEEDRRQQTERAEALSEARLFRQNEYIHYVPPPPPTS